MTGGDKRYYIQRKNPFRGWKVVETITGTNSHKKACRAYTRYSLEWPEEEFQIMFVTSHRVCGTKIKKEKIK